MHHLRLLQAPAMQHRTSHLQQGHGQGMESLACLGSKSTAKQTGELVEALYAACHKSSRKIAEQARCLMQLPALNKHSSFQTLHVLAGEHFCRAAFEI